MPKKDQRGPGTEGAGQAQDIRAGRRKLLKNLGAAAGGAVLGAVLPTHWTKPVIQLASIPPHAQASVGTLAYFSVSVLDVVSPALVPTVVSGTAATTVMTAASISYGKFSINFVGATGALPDPVSVTFAWNAGGATLYNWDGTANPVGSKTANVPLAGGTVGMGGTVLDTGASAVPTITMPSGNTASITFSAPGVQSMAVTVSSP